MRRRQHASGTAPEHLQRFREAEWRHLADEFAPNYGLRSIARRYGSWLAYRAAREEWAAANGVDVGDPPAFPIRYDDEPAPDEPWDESLI